MVRKLSKRALELLHEFAEEIKPFSNDFDGLKRLDAANNPHKTLMPYLFAVLSEELDHPAWNFVRGHQAVDMIRHDRHKVEFLGPAEFLNPKRDKEGELTGDFHFEPKRNKVKIAAYRKRLLELLKEQEVQIEQGKVAKLARAGLSIEMDDED